MWGADQQTYRPDPSDEPRVLDEPDEDARSRPGLRAAVGSLSAGILAFAMPFMVLGVASIAFAAISFLSGALAIYLSRQIEEHRRAVRACAVIGISLAILAMLGVAAWLADKALAGYS